MKVTFINTKQHKCGVFQMGTLISKALHKYSSHEITTLEIGSEEDFHENEEIICASDIVLFNYQEGIFLWLSKKFLSQYNFIAVGINHEFDFTTAHNVNSNVFDYRICFDPSLQSRCPNVAFLPRILPECPDHIKKIKTENEIFTIGSFGFATPGKIFPQIIYFIKQIEEKCKLRLHLPFSFYVDHDGENSKKTIEECHKIASKNGIEFESDSDFFDSDGLLQWLSQNDLNIFLYEECAGRGISSVTDWALAVDVPLALSDSNMFRHLKPLSSHFFLSMNTINDIIQYSVEDMKFIRNLWSTEKIIEKLDQIFIHFKNDAITPQAERANTILNDAMRSFYKPHIDEIAELCPEYHKDKIERANVQQAFVKAKVEEYATTSSNILCVGYNSDTAYYALKAKGYTIDAIDPLFNIDLQEFYSGWDGIKRYDVIFSTSVIEHVKDDVKFIAQITDLLAPGGYAIITMDFNDDYHLGMSLPNTDERFYTVDRILSAIVPQIHNCSLVDCYDWKKYSTDFTFDGAIYCFASLVFRKNSNQGFEGDENQNPFILKLKNQGERNLFLQKKVIAQTRELQEYQKKLAAEIEKVQNLRDQLGKKDGDLENAQKECYQKNNRLKEIYNSRGWMLLIFCRSVKFKIMPSGSIQHKSVEFIYKKIKSVVKLFICTLQKRWGK